MFSMVRVVPRLAARMGNTALLISGLALAALGMSWLSRLGADTPFFPAIAVPLVMLGVGMGGALTPLTAAGIAGVEARDAGAASGVVNAAHQLGGSLGLSVLVTVFAAGDTGAGRFALTNGVAAAITGSAVLLTLALAIVVLVVQRAPRGEPAVVTEAEWE
jgi:hypothetical protein